MNQARRQSSDFRILIVDDEKSVLDLMSDILRECGWTVEAHDSPIHALERAKRARYDALLLDLYMPELPGLLLHAKIKVVDPELAYRTVFVTGHFSREELRKEMTESALVVMKPFNPAEFVGMVSRVLPEVPRQISTMAAPSLATHAPGG
jgi:DNA-binding NtrC family response regulator